METACQFRDSCVNKLAGPRTSVVKFDGQIMLHSNGRDSSISVHILECNAYIHVGG